MSILHYVQVQVEEFDSQLGCIASGFIMFHIFCSWFIFGCWTVSCVEMEIPQSEGMI